jgi:hypothetical protein
MRKLSAILVLLSVLILTCSSDSGRTFTLLDDSLMAGAYVYMWDQYDGDEYVPAGSYSVRMRAGDFEQSLNFRIAASNNHVEAECDSSGTTGGGVLPSQFALILNTTEYAPQDTICIFYDLPTSCDVQILIRER